LQEKLRADKKAEIMDRMRRKQQEEEEKREKDEIEAQKQREVEAEKQAASGLYRGVLFTPSRRLVSISP
jgi:predicted RecB family nuclease